MAAATTTPIMTAVSTTPELGEGGSIDRAGDRDIL